MAVYRYYSWKHCVFLKIYNNTGFCNNEKTKVIANGRVTDWSYEKGVREEIGVFQEWAGQV